MLPPKPRLFKAIAILGMLLGTLGTVNAVTNLTMLSREDRLPLDMLGFEPKTEAEAQVTRKMQRNVQRVIERHRAVSVGLHATNAVLSLLLLAGSVTLASGRLWAHSITVQALAASGLYELPASAHEIRLVYEKIVVQRGLIPELLRATGQPPVADLTLTTRSLLMLGVAVTVGMALLRLAFYGTGFWYLRRRDVRAWFSAPRDM